MLNLKFMRKTRLVFANRLTIYQIEFVKKIKGS
jgi:hypothetical protein